MISRDLYFVLIDRFYLMYSYICEAQGMRTEERQPSHFGFEPRLRSLSNIGSSFGVRIAAGNQNARFAWITQERKKTNEPLNKHASTVHATVPVPVMNTR